MGNGSGGSSCLGARFRVLNALLLIIFCTLSVSSKGQVEVAEPRSAVWRCADFLLRVGNTRVIPFDGPSKVTRHVGKAIFYPLVALANLARFSAEAFRSGVSLDEVKSRLGNRIRKDVFHSLAYAGLVIAAQMTSIPYHQYDSQLNVQVAPQEHIVVVNGFEPSKKLHQFANYRFDTRYGNFEHAEKIIAKPSWEGMLGQLRDNAKINGKAKLLELHGEAVPGAFFVRTDGVNGATLRQYMASSGKAPSVPEMVTLSRELVNQGIVEKDGIIVLFGCSAGAGEEGEQLMVSVGKLLAPDGGHVYASEVILTSSLLDQLFLDAGVAPPKAVGYFQDVFDVGMPIVRLTREAVSFVQNTDPITFSAFPVRHLQVEAH